MKSKKTRFIALALGLTAMLGGMGLSACTGDNGESSSEPASSIETVEKKVEIVGQNSLVQDQAVRYGLKLEGISSGAETAWASSDNAIFTVDKTGEVKALAVGKATLSATIDGTTATLEINVLSRETQSFNVRFRNYDGTLLYQTKVPYGQKAAYFGADPERTADYQTVYVFTGWDKDLEETLITEDTTFTAQFGESDGSGFVFNKLSNFEYQLTAYAGDPTVTFGSITVPSSFAGKPVTTIGGGAFSSKDKIIQITIQEGVTSIGNTCFYNCTELTTVNLPDSVYGLGDRVFESCDSLTTVKLPSLIDKLPTKAFYQCPKLETIELPNQLKTIGSEAFSGCTALTSISIPDSVTRIEMSAFENCTALKTAHISNSITSLGSIGSFTDGEFFRGCTALETVTGMEKVTELGYAIFYGCSALGSIPVPFTQFESIGSSCFRESGIKEVVLSDDMFIYDNKVAEEGEGRSPTRGLHSSVFQHCHNLEKVQYGKNMVSTPMWLFSDCYKLDETKISGFDSVTALGQGTFAYCSFKELNIGTLFPKVTTFENQVFESMLSHGEWDDEGNSIPHDDRPAMATLTKVTISNTVTTIGYNCFRNNYILADVAFASGNTNAISINYGVFDGCVKLAKVDFGDNAITAAAPTSTPIFNECTSLTEFAATGSHYSTDSGVLFNADKSIIYSYPAGKADTSYTVPATVTSIGASANSLGNTFRNAANLESLTLQEGLKAVYDAYAFAGMTGLTSLTFPASMETFNVENVFNGDTALASVTFQGSNLTSLPANTFSGCTALKTVTLGTGQNNIVRTAFDKLVASTTTDKASLTDIYMYPSETSSSPNIAGGALCYSGSTSSGKISTTSSVLSGLTIHWGGDKASWQNGTFGIYNRRVPAIEFGIKIECTDGTITPTGATTSGSGSRMTYTYTWEDVVEETPAA